VIPPTMFLDSLLNKPARFGPTSKAKAKRIHRLSRGKRDLSTILLDIYSCHEWAKDWNKLSSTERIMLEQKWTDLMLELLRTGNIRVMHSIRYRLREQTREEGDEMELKHTVEDELQLPRDAEKRSGLNAVYQGEQNGSTNPRT
jgi:hypothetical protein